jgi:hypothetical protein
MTLISKEIGPICEKHQFIGYHCIQCLMEEKEEYAKQQSIAFAEWVEKRWVYDDDEKTWSTFTKGDPILTTEQLYAHFISQQE